ncbi:MAG: proteasome-activating nucleotidase, partial [Candidatus Methanomethylophilaceae archaeon]|nr:proteasome-activating nucleotidase [Candidatus Methanomethylophilaceae archaeon]
QQIFTIHLRRMNVAEEVSPNKLADLTEGASGAEIKSICTEAGMLAIRDNRDTVLEDDFLKVKTKVLEAGRNKIKQAPTLMFG